MPEKMTEGEKMIWAAAYNKARAGQIDHDEIDVRIAVRSAASEVEMLRFFYDDVAGHFKKCGDLEGNTEILGMLNEMLGNG